jgi:hypothetical protein
VQRAEGHVQLSDIEPGELPRDRPVHMSTGQHMRTLRGRAEVLLSPGNYWRISGNSEVQLVSGRFSDIELRLLSGAMIVELAEGRLGRDFEITMLVDDFVIRPDEHGEYLLRRREGSPLELQVLQGRAEVRAGDKTIELDSGRGLRLTPELDDSVEKVSEMQPDRLLTWSRTRSRELMLEELEQRRSDRSGVKPVDPPGVESIFSPPPGPPELPSEPR